MKELFEKVFKSSSKRILGGAAFLVAVVGGFIGFNEVMWAFLTFAGAAIGLTTFEKK